MGYSCDRYTFFRRLRSTCDLLMMPKEVRPLAASPLTARSRLRLSVVVEGPPLTLCSDHSAPTSRTRCRLIQRAMLPSQRTANRCQGQNVCSKEDYVHRHE